jgi:multidrug efflux system membrane fusion protein
MKKPGLLVAAAAVIALLGGAAAMQWFGANERAAAQASRAAQPRVVSVEVGSAVKKRVPVIIEALGTVTPLASVAVRTRIDSEIVGIHFADGALVKTGDLLVSLDTRAIEAQIRQAEAQLARDQAQLEGAERDLRRYTELVARQSTPQINLDNARTQADVYRAAIRASQALIDNLKVQLSYCTIHAPISGRISQANVKIGNQVRTADVQPITTINQVAPVYVSFTVPQRALPEVRRALASGDAPVEAIVPGEDRRARGSVTMIENAVDSATGMGDDPRHRAECGRTALARHARHRKADLAVGRGGGRSGFGGAGEPARHVRLRRRRRNRQGAAGQGRADARGRSDSRKRLARR